MGAKNAYQMAHKVKVLVVLDGLQMIDFFIVLHIKELEETPELIHFCHGC